MSKNDVKPSCEQIIDMLPDPFVVIDRDYRIIAANRSYARHYNREPDEVIGCHCYEVSHHSDIPCSQHGEHCPLETVFITHQTIQLLHTHYDATGREEWVQLSANPIFDNNGIPVFMGEYLQTVPQTEGHDLPLTACAHSPEIPGSVSVIGADPLKHKKQLLNRMGGRLQDEEILAALAKSKGHRLQASQLLGVSERTLYRYIRRLRQVE